MTEFETLFSENREFIFKYLMKMTRDITLSEELTQETFFRAYMNYASLRNKEKISVWICQIAKNTYFAWYNDQKKIDSLKFLQITYVYGILYYRKSRLRVLKNYITLLKSRAKYAIIKRLDIGYLRTRRSPCSKNFSAVSENSRPHPSSR